MKRTGHRTIALISLCIYFCLFLTGCKKPIYFGNRDIEGRKTDLCSIIRDFPSYSDDTVSVKGSLISEGRKLYLAGRTGILLLAPVGFDIPDSLLGGKTVCEGIVFYHEGLRMPGIAALGVRVRSPSRRDGD